MRYYHRSVAIRDARYAGECAFVNWMCEPSDYTGDVAEAWEHEHSAWPTEAFEVLGDELIAELEQEFRAAWAVARDRVQLMDERRAS